MLAMRGKAYESRDAADARFRKAITMKDAKTLLLEFLAAVTRGQNLPDPAKVIFSVPPDYRS